MGEASQAEAGAIEQYDFWAANAVKTNFVIRFIIKMRDCL
jgi:hypothetical protein